MATIIKQGNSNNLAVCRHCGCIFLYSQNETFKDRNHYYVHCPDCHLINNAEEKNKKIIIMEDE